MGALFGGSKPTPVAAPPTQQGPSQEELLKKRREGQISAGKRRGFRSTLLSPIGETVTTAKNTLLGQ